MIKNDYLFEAEKLYQNKLFEACLELLCKHSGFAKGLNRTLFAAAILLCGLSVWLFTREVAAAVAFVVIAVIAGIAVAVAVVGIAVAVAFVIIAVIVSIAAAVAVAGVAAAGAAVAVAVLFCGSHLGKYITQFLCRLIIRHEKTSKAIKAVI